MQLLNKILEHLNPAPDPQLATASTFKRKNLPTLWLLGKTGGGKSSVIQALTGRTSVEVGNGFQPCTMSSHSYDFPDDKPVLCFLDTRGLSESDYDAADDIRHCLGRSHALLVVMKADDPEQSRVLKALEQIRKAGSMTELILIHTGIELLSDEQRARCLAHNKEQVKSVWKTPFDEVAVDFELDRQVMTGLDELRNVLSKRMPIVAEINTAQCHSSQEEQNYTRLKTEILWYAGVAGASDAVPAVGAVSVPMIQAKMLHSLASQYGLQWNKTTFAEFTGALGAGFIAHYLGKLGIRQLVKLIPVYGQTVGAATAAAMSFATTFALGRVACQFLYHKSKGEPVSEEKMKELFKTAFFSIKEVAEHETRR